MSELNPKGARWPWWRRALVVLCKEMRDHLRDRRSLVLALIYPLLGPMVVAMLVEVAVDQPHGGSGPRAVTVAARGVQDAPGLAAFLAGKAVTLVAPGRGDPVVMEIPDGAEQGGPFTVRLLFDANSPSAAGLAAMLGDLINGYGRQRGHQFLAAHGIDPAWLQPVTVERVHTGRKRSLVLMLYNLIPPLLVFMIFLGAVYLALDTTVGERERGTLEPLLTAPIRRSELLLGKAGAAFLFTLITVVINLSAFCLALSLLAAHLPGLEPPPVLSTFLAMFVVSLPVMVLAVTLQLAVAAIARTMKEAQIYLGLLPLVPALPGIASAMTPVTPQLWMATLPVFGQMVTCNRLIGGAAPEPLFVILSAVTTLLLAAAIFWWSIQLYQEERFFTPD